MVAFRAGMPGRQFRLWMGAWQSCQVQRASTLKQGGAGVMPCRAPIAEGPSRRPHRPEPGTGGQDARRTTGRSSPRIVT